MAVYFFIDLGIFLSAAWKIALAIRSAGSEMDSVPFLIRNTTIHFIVTDEPHL